MGKHGTSQKLPSVVGIDEVGKGDKPWVDPNQAKAAKNAGGAGKMLHTQLKKNKSTGVKPR